MSGKKALKVALPVICGLLVILVITLIVGLFTGKVKNPKIEDPKGSYAVLDGYTITNEKMYINLRYSYGVSKLKDLVDTDLLKGLTVDTASEEYIEFVNEAVYGTNYKELDAEEKAEAEKVYKNNLKLQGYRTEQDIKNYQELNYRRYLYAKSAFEAEKAAVDFTFDEYQKGYEGKYADSLAASATGIVVVFDSEAQGKAILKKFGIELSSSGWVNLFANKANEVKVAELEVKKDELEDEAKTNEAAVKELEKTLDTDAIKAAEKALNSANSELEDLKDAFDELKEPTAEVKAEKQAEIKAKLAEIEALEKAYKEVAKEAEFEALNHVEEIKEIEAEIKELEKDNYLTQAEVELLFVEIYNYLYAYFVAEGDVNVFDVEGNVKAEYKVLKEGVHYEVIEHEEETEKVTDKYTGEESDKVKTEAYTEVKFNFENLAKFDGKDSAEGYNKFSRFVFSGDEATAMNSKVNSQLFTTLKFPGETEKTEFTDTYTKSSLINYAGQSTSVTMDQYFLAIKLAGQKAKKSTEVVDFAALTGELQPSEALKEEIKAYLLEEKLTSTEQERLLYANRAKAGLKIYDHVMDHKYGSQYNALHGTTLKLTEGEDYTAYKLNKKNSKTIAFQYEVDGATKEVTAQKLFELLEEQYGALVIDNLMYVHMLLSNKEFNKVYNPETGEKYDKEAIRTALKDNVKTLKYYFNAGYYETSEGFGGDYGWDNFLRDVLCMEDEYELIARLVAQSDAEEAYIESTYTDAELRAEIEKLWDEYYELSVINLVVYVDQDLDGGAAQTDYLTKEGATQEKWSAKQEELAVELANKVFAEASLTGKKGLYEQLAYIKTVYGEADMTDPEWGKYKQAGLKIKPENAATYNNSSSLVQGFLDVLKEEYAKIEAAGYVGETFSSPYHVDNVFPTEFGYHKIAIVSTSEKLVFDSETEATKAAQIDKMFSAKYFELYEETLLEEWKDETYKKEKLVELGFAEDYELSKEMTTALQYYYDGAIAEVEDEILLEEHRLNATEAKVESTTNGQNYKFTDAKAKERFDAYLATKEEKLELNK